MFWIQWYAQTNKSFATAESNLRAMSTIAIWYSGESGYIVGGWRRFDHAIKFQRDIKF